MHILIGPLAECAGRSAQENAHTRARRGLLRGWVSGPRPPNNHRRLRGRREVCAEQGPPIVVTVAAPDPIRSRSPTASPRCRLAIVPRSGSPSDPLAFRRHGPAQLLSEFVGTFGLLSVIWGCSRFRAGVVPFAVGAYITAAYWFTASTSFANPAVTIARSLSNTFAGIRPTDVLPFIMAQFAGGLSATLLFRSLIPGLPSSAKNIVVPHGAE